MIRRFDTPRIAGQAYRPRPGAYGVILKGRSVLLALNACPGEEIALPGGGIDPGETPVRALHREAMEETGWRIRIRRRLGAYRRFTYMPEYDLWAEKLCHIYLCEAARKVAEPSEPDHVPIWMDIAEAPSWLSTPGDRAFAETVSAARR